MRGGFLYVAQRDAGVECGGDAGQPDSHRGRDRASIAYGSNRPLHLDAFRPYAKASYDAIYIA